MTGDTVLSVVDAFPSVVEIPRMDVYNGDMYHIGLGGVFSTFARLCTLLVVHMFQRVLVLYCMIYPPHFICMAFRVRGRLQGGGGFRAVRELHRGANHGEENPGINGFFHLLVLPVASGIGSPIGWPVNCKGYRIVNNSIDRLNKQMYRSCFFDDTRAVW